MSHEGARAPAGWLASGLLFGVPALVFALLFHVVGPALQRSGLSWWVLFHLLLVLPLAALLLAALLAGCRAARGGPALLGYLRLSPPGLAACLWGGALAGFMYGGALADSLAVILAWAALWAEPCRRPAPFVAAVVAVAVKRAAPLLESSLGGIHIFQPSAFFTSFFGHFGPRDFMGTPLAGAWWIVVYYAVVMLIVNIGGEELWWRGYVLPRQERAFGRRAWVVHGILWSAFHIFMQPTLWDTARMAVTGTALAFVAQRTRSTWPGIIGHAVGNLPFFLGLVEGARGS
jgi:membrane protease YdiL (CAAX protease family)